MRFVLAAGVGGAESYTAVAQAADETGWHWLALPDSVLFPKTSDSIYPYNDTATVREFISTTPFIEPFIAMASMAAVTTRLSFYPGVMKVPVRQPLIVAKLLTSLAVVSNNRVALGAGIGPWREEFEYNGMNFERRGKMLDECIDIIRGAMTGEFFEFHGENYDFGPMKMLPVPTRPVPIIIGGHSRPALRRAARTGDGWMSAPIPFDELKGLIEELDRYRAELGTAGRTDFQVHGFDPAARTVDDFKRLEDIGVTDACVSPWFDAYAADGTGLPTQTRVDAVRRFADEVIARF